MDNSKLLYTDPNLRYLLDSCECNRIQLIRYRLALNRFMVRFANPCIRCIATTSNAQSECIHYIRAKRGSTFLHSFIHSLLKPSFLQSLFGRQAAEYTFICPYVYILCYCSILFQLMSMDHTTSVHPHHKPFHSSRYFQSHHTVYISHSLSFQSYMDLLAGQKYKDILCHQDCTCTLVHNRQHLPSCHPRRQIRACQDC